MVLVCSNGYLLNVSAEEESSETEYGSYDEYLLDNSVSFLSDVSPQASSFDNSQACIKFLELTYAQQQTIINLNHSAKTNNLVIMSSSGKVYTLTGAWFTDIDYTGGSITAYVSSTALNDGYGGRWQILADGTLTKSSTPNFSGTIAAVFYWNRLYGGNDPFGNITFDPLLCSVKPETTPPTFPSDDAFACNIALNEVISNDYVASLVAYAEKQNYTEPYYIYRVFYTDSADDMNVFSNSGLYTEIEPFSIKGYVLALDGYTYPQTYVLEYKQLRKLCTDSVCAFGEFNLLDSMMYPFYELVLTSSCLETGEFSEIQATENVNTSIQQTIVQNQEIIAQQKETNSLINQVFEDNGGTENLINESVNELNDLAIMTDIQGIETSLSDAFKGDITMGGSLTFPAFEMTIEGQQYQIWSEKTFNLSFLDENFGFLMSTVRTVLSIIVCIVTFRGVKKQVRDILHVD